MIGFCENAFTQKYLQEGNKYLQEGQYAKADSLYTLGLSVDYNEDAYFNRGVTRFYMNNMSGGCSDIKILAERYDKEAKELWTKYCIIVDSSEYINQDGKKRIHTIRKEKYSNDCDVAVYDEKDVEIAHYRTISGCTVFDKCYEIPQFFKGNNNIDQYIYKNIDTNKHIYDPVKGNTLNMYMQFYVLTTGKVFGAKILDSQESKFQDKVLHAIVQDVADAIMKLPDFKPAEYEGKPVNFRFIVPVIFDFTNK